MPGQDSDGRAPVISALYSLSGVAAAVRHFGEGHARGRVFITV